MSAASAPILLGASDGKHRPFQLRLQINTEKASTLKKKKRLETSSEEPSEVVKKMKNPEQQSRAIELVISLVPLLLPLTSSCSHISEDGLVWLAPCTSPCRHP